MLYSFKECLQIWISNRKCSKSPYLIVWGFFKTENHSWHLFFFLTERQAKKAKEEGALSDVKPVFWSTYFCPFSRSKKLGSFFQELHNFSICKLDSHGSSIYLAIQDSGGHHSSLILCRRIFRRAWRTWLIQFIKVRHPKLFILFYLFLLILNVFDAFNVLDLKKPLAKGPLKSAHFFHFKHM